MFCVYSDTALPTWLEDFVSEQKGQVQALSSLPENGRILVYDLEKGLRLTEASFQRSFVQVDFFAYRQAKRQIGKSDLLCRAVKNKSVIDATCGLASDSAHLLFSGFEVTAFERNPFIYALVRDGLERFDDPLRSKMRLFFGEAINGNLVDQTIYFDPMYPSTTSKRKSRKEMDWLQELVGSDIDSASYLVRLLNSGATRVVVKRPLKSPHATERVPVSSFKGKTVRFDVYV